MFAAAKRLKFIGLSDDGTKWEPAGKLDQAAAFSIQSCRMDRPGLIAIGGATQKGHLARIAKRISVAH